MLETLNAIRLETLSSRSEPIGRTSTGFKKTPRKQQLQLIHSTYHYTNQMLGMSRSRWKCGRRRGQNMKTGKFIEHDKSTRNAAFGIVSMMFLMMLTRAM